MTEMKPRWLILKSEKLGFNKLIRFSHEAGHSTTMDFTVYDVSVQSYDGEHIFIAGDGDQTPLYDWKGAEVGAGTVDWQGCFNWRWGSIIKNFDMFIVSEVTEIFRAISAVAKIIVHNWSGDDELMPYGSILINYDHQAIEAADHILFKNGAVMLVADTRSREKS